MRMDFRNKWVLVTGATSGLGLELARALAREHRANLLAVGRRADRLKALASEAEGHWGVRVEAHPADLADPQAVQRIADAARKKDLYAAVLCAGVTYYGRALDEDDAGFAQMLATNVAGLATLARATARQLVATGTPGGVMLMSSMGGLTPVPYQTSYAATKAFVNSFGRGLNTELRGSGVTVTVVAPGGVDTEMITRSGLHRQFKPGSWSLMPADRCARLSLDAFARRQEFYVPGVLNRVGAAAMRLVPTGFLARRLAAVYGKGLPVTAAAPEGEAAGAAAGKSGAPEGEAVP